MKTHTSEQIYREFKTSRQAIAQFAQRQKQYAIRVDQAEAALQLHRRDHGGLGLVKAYYEIKPEGLGRDRFVREMQQRGWALPIRRSYHRTTRSGSYRYPNLIKGLVINAINLVWQSDTTYFRIGEQWYYLTFIIDVYSRRVLAAQVSTSLSAQANVAALKQALKIRRGHDLSQLIFHSDGGTQYRFAEFIELLRRHGISSSMCDAATDNAYAEKINDVMKNEYLEYSKPTGLTSLRTKLAKAVRNYNQKRHHGQLPFRVSPQGYESYLLSEQAATNRPYLLIRDGQRPAYDYDFSLAGPMQAQPLAKASRKSAQILPAFIQLDLPVEDRQLSLNLI